jgi:hypothetical protein
MAEPQIFEQRRHLSVAMAALAQTRSLDDLVAALATTTRAVAGSEGVAVIRRVGDQVAYVAEDAVRPLWKGRSFAIEACISGMAILDNKPVLIPDIYADARVPHAAYRPTFVRSMAMYPIGFVAPTMAVGAYWRDARPVDAANTAMLATLARFASVTLSRLNCASAA